MIKMYMTVAFRNLIRNRLFSTINIVGLSLSMAVGLVFTLNIKRQFDYDKFHPYPDRTYRIVTDKIFELGTDHFASSPAALAQELGQYSFVEKVTRLHGGQYASLLANEKDLPISLRYTDTAFFELFNFNLAKNQRSALSEPNSIVISEEKAKGLWGDTDAVGRILNIPGKGNFKVTGVVKQNKKPTHFQFDALASSASIKDTASIKSPNNWSDLDGYTYVLLRKGASARDLENALEQISQKAGQQLRATKGNKVKAYEFVHQNLLKINPSTQSMVIDEMNRGVDWQGIAGMSGLILMLMIMVAFNYTGLSLARSISRAKEVGVRKINGAKRYQIFIQFLSESTLLTAVSLSISCLILPFLEHVPLFRDIIASIEPDVSSALWIIAFAVLVSLLAGGLPAWILSSFNPIDALQKLKNFNTLSGTGLRRVLITIQFAVTTVSIILLVVSKKQIDFERDFDYGFNYKDLIYLQAESADIESLRASFSQIASVKDVSATSGIPLREFSSGSCSISIDKKSADPLNVEYYSTDARFIPAMNVELIAGTNFRSGLGSSNENSVILNQKAVKQLNFKNAADAVGSHILLDSTHVQIVGVYKDFINWNVKFGSMPFVLRFRPSEFDQLIVKIAPENKHSTVAALKAAWTKIKPKKNFEYEFYQVFMSSSHNSKQEQFLLFDFLTALVISISCLGLIGMVAYSVELRVKEIGLRRTLGASGHQLIWLVSRDFTRLLLIAGMMGLPFGYYIGYEILKEYAYRIDLSVGLLACCFIAMFFIGLLTILSQTYRVSYMNPVESLRNE